MNKFIKLILYIVILICVGILGYYVSYSEEVFKVLDEKIIPIVVGIGGGITGIYSLFSPIISKLDYSNKNLDKAIKENNKIIYENNTLKNQLEIGINEIEKLKKSIDTLNKIVQVGLATNEEKVKDGTANKIFKIGEEYNEL